MITSNAAYLNLLSYSNKLQRILTAQSTAGIQQTLLLMPHALVLDSFNKASAAVNQWIALHPQSTSGVVV